ncbi:F-type H+-transporting ATPase subunit gamma [Parabacteroides sp. PF5-5]|uniref:ATP synthase F1 subunit gamma n=1 Tax=unclassified Parabacteroides TaxID=2649774 RepID=UPI002473B946|nr:MULTISPECIES: ATP synthase F1 subunit gamma [unclassified Parabacteroides]MDH6304748.1 F-type H+-transporting ATPase subunit gamma [Parabacteroides sp. PH5-39]MDH6315637.1 F-type H+-transporting ATPase subunit gamma [Parabacteroides sp. PF5-13]MDH6319298.1 F-type H+-transporting ATPase subunit gamma [Parabacteroides sp. PH5-13]MDH6323029.1 F-type H+-transporting ATPase subunit gamma [Parabacteroides sp. PH5-8]MDH6326830.1 F-type H+-transporting ATPase subunit gamma [Parabacteroides sp. PH5-
MASLKEVKRRIASVQSTRKITQARQMVSSAQLHRSQSVLEKAVAYKESLDSMLCGLVASDSDLTSPYLQKQEGGVIAVVIMASNSGMCGSFNAKMEKELSGLSSLYPGQELLFFPIGKKIREAVLHQGFEVEENFDHLAEKTSFEESRSLSRHLMQLFRSRKVKQVEMLYYHFKTVSTQLITYKTLLPYTFTPEEERRINDETDDYILEPSRKELAETLVEMCIHADFHTALMDNQTSEHAARTIAMQIASENADDILAELQTSFNKLRQNNITNDLLDINSSSFA